MESIYYIENIKHGYGGEFNLDIPELQIEEGSSIGLYGHNGCGKSTLLRLLAFIEKPAKGNIYFMGERVENPSLYRRTATLVLQEPFLLKRSVFENVAYGLKIRGQKNIEENVIRSLEMVGLNPDRFSQRKWFELSGGEAQRVCLASRIILRPKVLLLDEPTASCDYKSTKIIRETIEVLKREFNTTLVIASHDTKWLFELADEVLSVEEGRIQSKISE